MPQKPETRFAEKFKRRLKKLSGQVYYHRTQEVAKIGIPDFYICYRGHFIVAELKTDVGDTTKLQDYHLAKVFGAGGIAAKVNPSNLEYFFEVLGTLKERSDPPWYID